MSNKKTLMIRAWKLGIISFPARNRFTTQFEFLTNLPSIQVYYCHLANMDASAANTVFLNCYKYVQFCAKLNFIRKISDL